MMSWKKIALLGAALLTAGCPKGPVQPPSRPARRAALPTIAAPVPDSLKIYTGADGIRLMVLRLEDGTWLLQMVGTMSRVDSKVLPCRLVDEGRTMKDWVARIDGVDFHILSRYWRQRGSPSYTLRIPSRKLVRQVPVQYNPDETGKASPMPMWMRHREQLADGSLAALQKFDLKYKIGRVEHTIARNVRRMNKRCHTQITGKILWASVSSKTPQTTSIQGPCGTPFWELFNLCRYDVIRKALQKHVRAIHCRIGPALRIVRQGKTLVATIPTDLRNRNKEVRRYLTEKMKWDGETLARGVYRERTTICTDGRGNYVGLRPNRDPDRWEGYRRRVFFGTASKLFRVEPVRYYGDGWFYDPRYKRRRGSGDRRFFSKVDVRDSAGRCELYCGTRKVKLRILARAQVDAILQKATFGKRATRRQPYGLARDRRGIYYYVDRAEGKTKRDFRLYRGPLGKLTRLKMTNIVSDTMGDVFTTPKGNLRLVLEKEHSYWIRGRRKKKLINVPIGDNLPMIFNELGVYLGKPYGTPCDIF